MRDRETYARKLALIKPELGKASLLIVTKTRSLEEIQIYYELGHRDFGENRVQELEEKARALQSKCPDIRWHMIGHLQTNKINLLFSVPNLVAIHSVHDRQLLEKLMKAEDKLSSPLDIFIQVNTSHEQEKSGFETYSELLESAEIALAAKKLKLKGLMTMGTLRTEEFEAEAGRCFQELNVMKEKLEVDLNHMLQTSMGMSQDWEIAVREGTDWVRLGTIMFV